MSAFVDGDPASDICLVGMAPGAEELAQDRPFIGGAGKLLWSIAKRCGIDRADCYIINTIGEWPSGSTGGPTPSQYAAWWEAFDDALGRFRGRIIVPLGGDALWRTTGLAGGIEKWRGYLVDPDELGFIERVGTRLDVYKTSNKKRGIAKGDLKPVKFKQSVKCRVPSTVRYIIPTLHPAGVLRSGLSSLPYLKADLARIKRATTDSLRPYRTSYSEVALKAPTSTPASLDIETGGAMADFTDITRVGMANAAGAWTSHWDSSARDRVKDFAAGPDNTLLIHNCAFDQPRLEAAGVVFNAQVRDTMLAMAVLEPDLKKGLNSAASLLLDAPRWKHEADDAPAKYNALDAIRTFELWEQQEALLHKTGQHGLFCKTIMGCMPTLIDMNRVGIRLDTEAQAAWIARLERDAQEATIEWFRMAPGVNFNSSHQVSKFLNGLGARLPHTKGGGDSVANDVLMKAKAWNPELAPLIDQLNKVKHLHKDLSTYAKVAAGADGRVHSSFAMVSKDEDGLGKELAGTLRITAKDPNLQNQHGAARAMYVPSPGYCFVGADYRSLEALLLAHSAEDAVLIEDLAADLHDANSRRLGVDRTRAKNAFYAFSYNGGAKTLYNTFLSKGFTVPMSECQALLDAMASRYHVSTAWRSALIEEARSRRYVQNGFGYRRYFPQQDFPVTKVLNTYIQSSGALMSWVRLPQARDLAKSLDGNLLLQVHDFFMLEVPERHAEAAAEGLRQVMEAPFPEIAGGFSCPVEVKISKESWGAMK